VGEKVTIDGGTGEVFAGVGAGVTEIMPEAAKLLGWARELGIRIGESAQDTGGDAPPVTAAAEVTTDDAVRALAIKGFATVDAMAAALLCSVDQAALLLGRLVVDRQAELADDSFQLTRDGKAMAQQMLAADSRTWGAAGASAALDAFLALDHRMKETVTAWQVRQVGGALTPNDHSDAAYDASVLSRLAQLHRDAGAWLHPMASGLKRLARYGQRLERAAAAVQRGDARFLASPRVDSYHSVWFELHEDLILLAGRTRAAEVEAGRA
jgi:pyruvate,orthophosphate dikinase